MPKYAWMLPFAFQLTCATVAVSRVDTKFAQPDADKPEPMASVDGWRITYIPSIPAELRPCTIKGRYTLCDGITAVGVLAVAVAGVALPVAVGVVDVAVVVAVAGVALAVAVGVVDVAVGVGVAGVALAVAVGVVDVVVVVGVAGVALAVAVGVVDVAVGVTEIMANDAVTFCAALIATTQLPKPLHPPLQPAKVAPMVGVAVSVMTVP